MSARCFTSLALAAALCLLAFDTPTVLAQSDEPLPQGAKVRLGTTRLRDLNSWAGAGLTPDGTCLLAFSVNGVARIDVTTGRPVEKPTKLPATGIGTRAELSGDGTRAASSNFNGAIVWDTATGATIAKVDRRVVFGEGSVALSADGKTLAVGGAKDDRDKAQPVTAIVWDVEANTKRAEVTVLQNQSANVALSGNGQVLATWGFHSEPNPAGHRPDPAKDFGRVVQFWDANSGKPLGRAHLDGFGQAAIALSHDGTLAALTSGTGIVQLVDPRSGTVLRQLLGRAGMGSRAAFAPDRQRLAVAGADGTVQIWAVADGTLTAMVESPFGAFAGTIRDLRFTANDRAVVFAVVGFTAIVWEVPSGQVLSPPGGHRGPLSGVMFTDGGKELLSGAHDGAIYRWNPATGKPLGEIVLRPGAASIPPTRMAYAPITFVPGGRIAIADRGTRAAYDLTTGLPLFAVPGGYESRSLLTGDARTLIVAPTVPFGVEVPPSLTLAVWDVATGTRRAELVLPAGELLAAATTPDRTRLLTAFATRPGKEGKTELLLTGWSLAAGGKKLGQLALPLGYGTAYLAPTPDNSTALVGTPDGKLIVFDIGRGLSLREIDTQRQAVTALPVFSPDGKSFAVGFGGTLSVSLGSARIYETSSSRLLRTLPGHLGAVTCLAFSPDGQVLATGSTDTTVLLWDLAKE